MRTTTVILAACLCVPLAGPVLAQGTAITPGQSLANQPGAAPAPSATAAPAEAPPKVARAKKASGKKMAKKPASAQ